MLPFRTLETLLGLQEALDLTRDAGFFENGTASSGVYPPVNIFEKNGDLVLVAELPGIKKEFLNIEVRENILRLSGTRTIDYEKNASYHRIERNSLKFDRTLRLPFNIESGRVQAEYKDGLLVVSLPRAESDKPKKIAIQ